MPDARIKQVHFTSRFIKSCSKLPLAMQALAEERDSWFRINPFDPRLKTHKLKGELAGAWSYSLDRRYRVLFRFLSDGEVLYYDVGTHDIYR